MNLRAVFSKFSKEESKEFINYLRKQSKRSDNRVLYFFNYWKMKELI